MATPKKRNVASLRVVPIRSGVRDFNELVEFYLYTAPLIDSVHSIGDIDEADQETMLLKILRNVSLKNDVFLKRIKSNSFVIRGLAGEEIDFASPAMICHRMSKETELHALLRHIRNAIAHGYVSIFDKKYVCFDDYDSEKNGGKHSARIVVTIDNLKTWKSIILKQR